MLVLVGALVDPGPRSIVWLGAIVADFAAATLAGRQAIWDLNPAHISERQERRVCHDPAVGVLASRRP